jgi:hypothetical protein
MRHQNQKEKQFRCGYAHNDEQVSTTEKTQLAVDITRPSDWKRVPSISHEYDDEDSTKPAVEQFKCSTSSNTPLPSWCTDPTWFEKRKECHIDRPRKFNTNLKGITFINQDFNFNKIPYVLNSTKLNNTVIFRHPGGQYPFYTFTYPLKVSNNTQYVPKMVLEIFPSQKITTHDVNTVDSPKKQVCHRTLCDAAPQRDRLSSIDRELLPINRSYRTFITKTKDYDNPQNSMERGHLAYNAQHDTDCSACVEQNLLPQRSHHNKGDWLAIEELLYTCIQHIKEPTHTLLIFSGGFYKSNNALLTPDHTFTNKKDTPLSFFKFIGFSKTLWNSVNTLIKSSEVIQKNTPNPPYTSNMFLTPIQDTNSDGWEWLYLRFPHEDKTALAGGELKYTQKKPSSILCNTKYTKKLF